MIQTHPPRRDVMKTPAQAFADRYAASYNAHDAAALRTRYTDDSVETNPLGTLTGLDAIIADTVDMWHAYSDAHITFVDAFARHTATVGNPAGAARRFDHAPPERTHRVDAPVLHDPWRRTGVDRQLHQVGGCQPIYASACAHPQRGESWPETRTRRDHRTRRHRARSRRHRSVPGSAGSSGPVRRVRATRPGL
jgi:hypothetical protein